MLKNFFIFCSCFLLGSLVYSVPREHQSSLEIENTRQKAVISVQNFGNELVQLLSNKAPFSDIQSLVEKTFDINKMAQHCCPVKYKTLSLEYQNLYKTRFSQSVCKAYHNILKKYYTPKGDSQEHFKIDISKTKCYPVRNDIVCTVVTDVFASNGARISVKWLVRAEKIENFVVEGTDMRAAKKRDMKTRYKQCGSNFKTFLDNILESCEQSS